MDDPNSLDLLRAVLDPVRLATLGSCVRSPASIEALVDRLGVERRVVAEAIGSHRASGLLDPDGSVHELFAHRGMERLWAPVMAANVASARVAERCGMVLEGIAPSCYIKSGVRYDQLNYGIARAQWADR